jgi:hypothetical protein
LQGPRSEPARFANLTIRLLTSDDFPAGAKRTAATDLTNAASNGALSYRSANRCRWTASPTRTTVSTRDPDSACSSPFPTKGS